MQLTWKLLLPRSQTWQEKEMGDRLTKKIIVAKLALYRKVKGIMGVAWAGLTKQDNIMNMAQECFKFQFFYE